MKNNIKINVRELKDLTEKQLNKLKSIDLLKDLYPNAPETYEEIRGKEPVMLDNPDIKSLKANAESYFNFVKSDDYHEDNDYAQYSFEAVLTAFYGKDFWEWHNKQLS